MVTVTEAAKQELKKKLTAHTEDPNAGIRLQSDASGQLSLVLGTESQGDQVVDHEGTKVLLVAPELSTSLEGISLDVEDTAEGSKLVVRKG